jgi:hypothetical protein
MEVFARSPTGSLAHSFTVLSNKPPPNMSLSLVLKVPFRRTKLLCYIFRSSKPNFLVQIQQASDSRNSAAGVTASNKNQNELLVQPCNFHCFPFLE